MVPVVKLEICLFLWLLLPVCLSACLTSYAFLSSFLVMSRVPRSPTHAHHQLHLHRLISQLGISNTTSSSLTSGEIIPSTIALTLIFKSWPDEDEIIKITIFLEPVHLGLISSYLEALTPPKQHLSTSMFPIWTLPSRFLPKSDHPKESPTTTNTSYLPTERCRTNIQMQDLLPNIPEHYRT